MKKKIKKSKRLTVSIPKGSIIHSFLENNGKVAHWVSLEQLVKQLPKSKEERAYKGFEEFKTIFLELYPQGSEVLPLIWVLLAKRVMKIPDEDGKEVFLTSSFYEGLKRLC